MLLIDIYNFPDYLQLTLQLCFKWAKKIQLLLANQVRTSQVANN